MSGQIVLNDLRPGDILLSLGVGNTSDAIRAFDGGQYSHAALWTGTDIIESTTPQVIRHSLDASVAKHARRYVDAYRHKKPGGKEAEVVAAAEAYLNRRYAYGDLALMALVLGTTAWLPTTASQEAALLAFCELNRFFALPKPNAGELVTCTELVARAYFEGGAPISVIPKGGNRFNGEAVGALFRGMLELLREGVGKRSLSSDVTSDWLATQRLLRDHLLAVADLDSSSDGTFGDGAVIEFGIRALAEMIAGAQWGANLVTPFYLESSPVLQLVGRLYAAPDSAISEVSQPSSAHLDVKVAAGSEQHDKLD